MVGVCPVRGVRPACDGELHFGVDLVENGGFDGLKEALHERIGVFLEDDREAHFHAIDAEVVFHHAGFDEVFAVAGVAHCSKGIGDEFRV